MKIYELLEYNGELLKRLCKAGIKTSDYKYMDLFADYNRLKQDGEKTTYAVALLSEKYGMSERKVYSVIRHLNSDPDSCKSRAVV